MKEDDDEEDLEGAAEESPDQSISSAMPTDSGVERHTPIVQDGKYFLISRLQVMCFCLVYCK